MSQRDDLSVYYWHSESGDSQYALLGAVDGDLLTSVAESVHAQFR